MKFLVIGLGSMGKRRLRLLKQNFDEIELFGLDNREDRRKEVEELYGIKTYSTLDDILNINEIDAVLICTAPISHEKLIKLSLDKNLNVFTEINLISEGYEEIINTSKSKGLKLFLSSTMLYREEIGFIKNKVIESLNKINYRYHVGQYLPDWHPWENYKDFFVGDKRTNGCRELFGIELPWIIKTFGKVKKIYVTRDKISNLDLDYPDCYNVILEHETGNKGVFSVDIVSRKAIRNLEIYSENMHIFWNGTPKGLEIYDIKAKNLESINLYDNVEQDKKYAENIVENAYLEELRIFIEKLKGNNQEKYTFEDDLYTLKLIDEIEGV